MILFYFNNVLFVKNFDPFLSFAPVESSTLQNSGWINELAIVCLFFPVSPQGNQRCFPFLLKGLFPFLCLHQSFSDAYLVPIYCLRLFFFLPTNSNCGSSFNYSNIFEERGEDMRQEGKRKRGRRNQRRWEEIRQSFMSRLVSAARR